MDKQKKQLIILVVLIVVGGGFGLWNAGLIGGDDEGSSSAAPETPAADPAAAAPSTTAAPGGPVVAGAPKVELKMPEEFVTFTPETIEWKWNGIWERDQPRSESWPVGDPFMVLNINVVDPERNAELKSIKDTWIVVGITETYQETREDITGPDGKPAVKVSEGYVYEVWFKGKNQPFKVGDRLPGTRFKIKDIFRSHKKTVGAGVALLGDTGASLVLKLAPASRYGK